MTVDDEARCAAGLRERAEALIPALAGRSAETEALRRLPDETVADVEANGLRRICQPRRFGGAEPPLDEAARIMATLVRGCASDFYGLCGRERLKRPFLDDIRESAYP